MSYARWGWNGSDVYVFRNVGGWLECCGCSLNSPSDGELFPESFEAMTTQDMLDHLKLHQAEGHTVPGECIEGLEEDREENDHWIANYDREDEARKQREYNEAVTELRRIAQEELGYEHPGPEKFDPEVHAEKMDQARVIYEELHGKPAPGLDVQIISPILGGLEEILGE